VEEGSSTPSTVFEILIVDPRRWTYVAKGGGKRSGGSYPRRARFMERPRHRRRGTVPRGAHLLCCSCAAYQRAWTPDTVERLPLLTSTWSAAPKSLFQQRLSLALVLFNQATDSIGKPLFCNGTSLRSTGSQHWPASTRRKRLRPNITRPDTVGYTLLDPLGYVTIYPVTKLPPLLSRF